MKMIKFICFALLLIFLVIVYNVRSSCADKDLQLDSFGTEDLQLAGRQRRAWSAFQLGWKKLLKGARLVRNDATIMLYRKHGSYDQALEDFYSLNPSHIRQAPDGNILAKVGDTDIYFRGRAPDRKEPGNFQALLIIPSKHEAPKMGLSNKNRIIKGIQYVTQ